MADPGDAELRERVEFALRGKTLKVYLYILGKGEPVGIREVQRALGFSSPSIAVHHLEKLRELGVVERDQYGRFVLARKVDVDVLRAFATIGRFTVPRLAFYAAFFTTATIFLMAFSGQGVSLQALLFGSASSIAFWYEAWRFWRRRPW